MPQPIGYPIGTVHHPTKLRLTDSLHVNEPATLPYSLWRRIPATTIFTSHTSLNLPNTIGR